MKFPIATGDVAVNVDIQLGSSLPAALQKTTTTAKATDTASGKELFCIEIKSAPASSVHPERAAQITEIQNTPGVLWKASAHPRFANQAPGASKDMNGVKGDRKQAIEAAIARGEIERHQ